MPNKDKLMQANKSSVSTDERPVTLDAHRILFKYSDKISELLFEKGNELISIISPEGKFIYCNPFFNNLGYRISDLINHNIFDYIHPDDAGIFHELFALYKKENMKAASYDNSRNLRCRIISKSGCWVEIEINISILTDNSDPSAFLLISRELDANLNELNPDAVIMHKKISDGTAYCKKNEEKHNKSVDKDIAKRKIDEEVNVLLAAFARESPHPILSSDCNCNIIYKNPAAVNILEGLGLDSPYSILPENHSELIESCYHDRKNYNNLEVRVKGHVFSWTYNPISGIDVIHLHGLDITDQKCFEEKLLHDSLHDNLTGLPNRSLFNDELIRAIKISKRRSDYHFAVLFLDLGRFKIINDSLGHLIGDKVLVEVSNRISSCLRPEDTASRFGGDEFTILLNNITDSSDPVRVSERIQKKISTPLNIEGNDIIPSASIGIVISSQEYSHPEDLLRDANTAMYRAKAEGISGHVIFDKAMHKQAVRLLQLESNLQHAFERKEYALYYQPIISFESGKIVGFEALLRWQHPKRGLILPDEFMPILEETGQIIPVGEWIIQKACSQLRSWHKKYNKKKHLFISINISSKQFFQPDLIEIISKILDNENLYPGYLNLEITESIIMHDQKKTSSMIAKLREMDVQIDIDDFGTGYVSLNNLHKCPIHALKIDRSLIAAMNGKAWSSVVPNTIITLAKHLEMDVVAEGVESAKQFKQLKNLDCGYAQGNFFSPPVDSNKAGALLLRDPEWE